MRIGKFGCTVGKMRYLAAIIVSFVCWNAEGAIPKAIFNSIEKSSFDVLIDNHLEGSGIIVHPSGLPCCRHATDEIKNMEARSAHLGRLSLQVVALDLGHDIALVKLPPRTQGYPFRPIASGGPLPGMDVYLYGTPSIDTGFC